MQKAKDMGYVTKPVWYNHMIKLYCHVGNFEKMDELIMDEMLIDEGIRPDQFTLTICLKACAAVSDSNRIDTISNLIKSDPKIIKDWNLYAAVATTYLKIGSTDKALETLREMELLMKRGKRKDLATIILLQLYSKTGNKDELYKIWNKYKKKTNKANNVYRSMISSLMKLEDFDGLENVFAEWESSELCYDFRIVNYLIDLCCRKGNMEKAEALLNEGILKGSRPTVATWCNLAGGYLMEKKLTKAIDLLKKAISICPLDSEPIRLETLKPCLEHLEGESDMDEFIRSLSPRTFPSTAVFEKLFHFIKTGELPSHSGGETEEEIVIEDERVN